MSLLCGNILHITYEVCYHFLGLESKAQSLTIVFHLASVRLNYLNLYNTCDYQTVNNEHGTTETLLLPKDDFSILRFFQNGIVIRDRLALEAILEKVMNRSQPQSSIFDIVKILRKFYFNIITSECFTCRVVRISLPRFLEVCHVQHLVSAIPIQIISS